MASTKIQNLPLKAPIGAMKIPTGGFGDYSITVSSIGDFIIDTFNLATKDYVDALLVEKEDRIKTTGGFLTPTSQNANVPDTTNDVIDEVAQALLDRIEYVKDNFGIFPEHNQLTGRSASSAHPSSSISHKLSNVHDYLQQNESDINTINNVSIPLINQSLLTKESLIETGVVVSPNPTFSDVPSTNNSAINSSLEALTNRDEFLNFQFKEGIIPTFDQAFADQIGGYPLNARIMLTTGDIVKSTVANNTVDPNIDMAGWVPIQKVKSIKDYGAKYNGSNDRQALIDCRAANHYFYVDYGTTNIEVFANERHAVGLGKPRVIVDPAANPAAVQLLDGSITENIDFVSSSDSKEWQRAEIKSNTIIKNVGFYNFKHASALPNAWGNYLENVENIFYENPRYGENGQSDIAIVDNVKNVTIINATNTVDDGVNLNIEPNSLGNIRGVNVIGGKYRRITLLENQVLNYGIRNVNIIGAYIKYLGYRGAETTITNSQIDEIEGNFFGYGTVDGVANAKREYAGQLRIDNAALSANKVIDEFVQDLSTTDTTSKWAVSQTEATQQYQKLFDVADGIFTRLNPNKIGTTSAASRDFYDVSASNVLAFVMRCRTNNDTGVLNYEVAQVRFYDASDVLINTHMIIANRGPTGSNIGFRNDVAVIKKPASAVKAKISLRTKPGCSLDVSRVGLFDLRLNIANGNFNSVVSNFGNPVFNSIIKRAALPTGSHGLMWLLNDIIELNDRRRYIVTVAGTATAQATFSQIESRKLFNSSALNFNLAANEKRDIVRTIAGAAVGDIVTCSISQVFGRSVSLTAEVTAADTVTIYLDNLTANVITVNATLFIEVQR